MSEEQYLRQRLADLHQSYMLDAQPLIIRLAKIQLMTLAHPRLVFAEQVAQRQAAEEYGTLVQQKRDLEAQVAKEIDSSKTGGGVA